MSDFKRGDTFSFSVYLPLTWPAGEWAARCKLFDPKTKVTYPITTTLAPPAGGEPRWFLQLRAEPEATRTWEPGKLLGDVEFTDNSVSPPFVKSSLDFIVAVLPDRTV